MTTTAINKGLQNIGINLPGNTKLDDIKQKAIDAKNRLDNTFSLVGTDPSSIAGKDMKSIQEGLSSGVTSKQTDLSNVTPSTDSYVSGDALESSAGAVGSSQDSSGYGLDDSPTTEGVDTNDPDSLSGIGGFKQGGLAKKKKKTKVKKKKQSGLASKK